MPKRVYSAGDRDDDAESNSNQSTSKRTRKIADDREIVRLSQLEKLISTDFSLEWSLAGDLRRLTRLQIRRRSNYLWNLHSFTKQKVFFSPKDIFSDHSSRRTHAEYYTLIKQPIDLIRIQQKIRTDEYQNLEQFIDDIQLLLTNAKTFYRVSEGLFSAISTMWLLSFRKIPVNGAMQMTFHDISIPRSMMKIPIENDR